jgi:hypothetical protein
MATVGTQGVERGEGEVMRTEGGLGKTGRSPLDGVQDMVIDVCNCREEGGSIRIDWKCVAGVMSNLEPKGG